MHKSNLAFPQRQIMLSLNQLFVISCEFEQPLLAHQRQLKHKAGSNKKKIEKFLENNREKRKLSKTYILCNLRRYTFDQVHQIEQLRDVFRQAK